MRPCRPLRRALEIDHEIFEHFPETKLHYPDLDALYGFSCIKYWTLFLTFASGSSANISNSRCTLAVRSFRCGHLCTTERSPRTSVHYRDG
jgi:hypothetical protein